MDRAKIFGVVAAVVGLAGCGRDPHFIVATKNFTESLILGEIVAQHLEAKLHEPVVRKFGLGGTLLAQQGLLSKEIDLYPEYTGTGYTNVLKLPPDPDAPKVLARLRTDYAKWNLEWLDPLGFDNTFAMVVRGEDARARHLETLSDAARDREGFTLGAGYEFIGREDGYPMLTKAYDIRWTHSPVTMDLGLLYQALSKKNVDMAAASETDGQLTVMDAKVLRDDKKAFPPYQACLVARKEALTPEIRAALAELAGKISTEAMRKMNFEVDGKHRQSREVAAEFLKQNGL